MKNFCPSISETTEISEEGSENRSAGTNLPGQEAAATQPPNSPTSAVRKPPLLVPAATFRRKKWTAEFLPRPNAAAARNQPPVLRRGWIFYDAQCRHCRAAAARFENILARRGFEFVPLQTPWVQKRLGLAPHAPLSEMRVLTVKNEDLGGAEALLLLARQVWWAAPLAWLARIPMLNALLDRVYRWVAAHRGCDNAACSLIDGTNRTNETDGTAESSNPQSSPSHRSHWSYPIEWLGLLILPTAAIMVRPLVVPWVFMWTMTGALFLGCKWLTLFRALRRGLSTSFGRALGYLLLWPGMDARSFLTIDEMAAKKRGAQAAGRQLPAACRQHGDLTLKDASGRLGGLPRWDWQPALPILKIALGSTLVFVLARFMPNEVTAGWIGMIGLVLILHFGLFDLAAVVWQLAGVDAKPIMNAPLQAQTLNEFWGRRWNGAFNQLMLGLFFRPLSHRFGTIRATLTAFLVSGLLHELVISLPAGASYGLPTAYFLLQGWGVIAQRSPFGKCHRLNRGVRGRLFTILLTAGPAFALFHPPFVRQVIIPFMQAIHAL